MIKEREVIKKQENINEGVIDNKSNDVILFKSREISNFPRNTLPVNINDKVSKDLTHLLSDVFKGASSVKGKTLKIVFDKKIQEGLDTGLYELLSPKDGSEGLYLTARKKVGKKFVGNGKIIEGGKVRQLLSGAFQLTSIAVAQSHLADIQKSLRSINTKLDQIQSKLESNDISKIRGNIEYLSDICKKDMQSGLSQSQKNTIEGISKEFSQIKNSYIQDFSRSIQSMEGLKDTDWFGSGDTYQAIKEILTSEQTNHLQERYYLILQLASLLKYVQYYFDSSENQLSIVNLKASDFEEKILDFKDISNKKISNLLSKKRMNDNDTLDTRREYLLLLVNEKERFLSDQLKEYGEREEKLETMLDNINYMKHNTDNLRIAVSFDSGGDVEKLAVIQQ